MNYKSELECLESVKDNEIANFSFYMSLEQVRSWFDTELSVRDHLISTHRTPI